MPRALYERHTRQAPKPEHPDAQPDDPDDREHARDNRGIP
jgi:hypothetical protein